MVAKQRSGQKLEPNSYLLAKIHMVAKRGLSAPMIASALSSSKNPYGSKTHLDRLSNMPVLSSSKNPYGSKTDNFELLHEFVLSSSKNPYGSKTDETSLLRGAKLSSSKNPYGSKTPRPNN